jgi:hypothetical protein
MVCGSVHATVVPAGNGCLAFLCLFQFSNIRLRFPDICFFISVAGSMLSMAASCVSTTVLFLLMFVPASGTSDSAFSASASFILSAGFVSLAQASFTQTAAVITHPFVSLKERAASAMMPAVIFYSTSGCAPLSYVVAFEGSVPLRGPAVASYAPTV